MRVGTKAESIPERLALAAGTIPTPLLETLRGDGDGPRDHGGRLAGDLRRARRAARRRRPPRAPAEARSARHGHPAGGAARARVRRVTASGRYRNAPAVEKFVLPDSPTTLRAYVGDFNRDMWDEFSRVEDGDQDGRDVWPARARSRRPLLGALHARAVRPDAAGRRRRREDDSRPQPQADARPGGRARRLRDRDVPPPLRPDRRRSWSSRAPRGSAARSCASRAWRTGSSSSSATCSRPTSARATTSRRRSRSSITSTRT